MCSRYTTDDLKIRIEREQKILDKQLSINRLIPPNQFYKEKPEDCNNPCIIRKIYYKSWSFPDEATEYSYHCPNNETFKKFHRLLRCRRYIETEFENKKPVFESVTYRNTKYYFEDNMGDK